MRENQLVPQPMATAEQPPVQTEIEKIERLVEQQQHQIDLLKNRLSIIVQSNPEEEANHKDQSITGNPMVSYRLYKIGEKLQNNIYEVSKLLEGLEI